MRKDGARATRAGLLGTQSRFRPFMFVQHRHYTYGYV